MAKKAGKVSKEKSPAYDPKIVEPKWQKYWEKEGIYKFDPDSDREIYSIDTPPPTVSGRLHIGHACSYTHKDIVARYKRLRGFNVFYPFGTDDNGIPSEKLVEKEKNVRSEEMGRQEFVKLCLKTLAKFRKIYIQDCKNIGMSPDWSIFYSTIDAHSQKISQRSFIDLYKKGRQYRKDAPTIWCTKCQTAIAQVQLEDKEVESKFNDLVFKTEDGKEIIIATTRPELLPACVAVFVHPDDQRYKDLVGKHLKVPLFDLKVEVLTDERADPEKETGIVMCCTFGDQTDAEWYKAHDLGLRIAITKDGKMTKLAGKYEGIGIEEARKAIIEDLKKEGLLVGQKKIKHNLNVHDRCGTPIEILKTKQWFVKYLDLKDKFIEQGDKLNWFPKFMQSKYNNWVNGLQWDWCISRQRHYGIPFPVWYCKKCEEVILAEEDQLPVDPLKDKPKMDKCPKCRCKEFIPEKDVMDTWATSSLTPQLATELFKDKPVFKRLHPMNMRTQAHDIISFWLFNTIVKSYLHWDRLPWKDAMISGWVLDPSAKKMSKSKGNTVSPQILLDKYGADALRFWAATNAVGYDSPFKEGELVNGKKNVVKLFNSCKFAIMHLEDYGMQKPKKLDVVDNWILSKLQKLIEFATESFDIYDFTKAQKAVEKFFWHSFCDNYIEFIKDRIYNPDKYGKDAKISAQYALYNVTLAVIKLFAPIMPFITEEVYQMYFASKEEKKSIHISSWPIVDKNLIDEEAEEAGDVLVDIVGCVRKYKSQSNVSLKTPISVLRIHCEDKHKELIPLIEKDILAVCKAEKLEFSKKVDLACDKFPIELGVKLLK